MADPYPDEFRLSLTSPSGASFNIEWKGKALEYRAYDEHYDPTRMERVQPSAEAWGKFWQAADSTGAWAWEPRYLHPSGAEGVQWQVALRSGAKSVRSYGANAFPGGKGPAVAGGPFGKFIQAVRELIGGLPLE